PLTGRAVNVPESPRHTATGVQWLRLNRQGEPEFHARATTLDYYADETVRLRRLTLEMLGGLDSPWRLTAPAGTALLSERRLLLEGEIAAESTSSEGAPIVFTTDRLWVDLLRRELRTENRVTVESGPQRATARGLRTGFSGERVQLLNEVQVDYVPRD
ncbi:MAG: LPS export ABC transporter periplasmic protein LptC, partial [Nevskiales bacterium]|nr:LPS export ABC transporter periplasmic protein LptC [Nevskiales bacterium]